MRSAVLDEQHGLSAPSPLDAPPARPSLDEPTARRGALLRVCAIAVATVLALPYSLASLVTDFRYAGALSELALIPVCALALALVAAWRHPWVAALRPGRADWALAGGAAVLAAGLVTVGPVLAGNLYYGIRPDLLAVPLVAAAGVCLLCGVRALVAFVLPLLLAVLTWPLPLRALLEPSAGALTAVTSAALRLLLQVAPLATPVAGEGDLRLTVPAPSGGFEVVVASACSGLTGVAGTLLVGLAAQYVLHGPVRSRTTWLTAAVVGAWLLNLVRILLLLAVGRLFGEHAALEVVHPVAGLLLLNLAFAGLLLAAPAFGLRLALTSPVPADTPLTDPAPVEQRMRPRAVALRGTALLLAAVLLGGLDAVVPATAGAYDDADPAASAFSDAPTAPPGFALVDSTAQPWSRVYYGEDSAWTRYRLAPTATGTGFSVWLDSITTTDWAALRAHPILDCYRFHDFDLQRVQRPVLAAGVLADEAVYRRPDGATWHVLSWQWPVRRPAGGALRHERVVLLASSERTDLAPARRSDDDEARPGGGLRALLAARWGAAGATADPNPGRGGAWRRTAGDLISDHLAAHVTPAAARGDVLTSRSTR